MIGGISGTVAGNGFSMAAMRATLENVHPPEAYDLLKVKEKKYECIDPI